MTATDEHFHIRTLSTPDTHIYPVWLDYIRIALNTDVNRLYAN